MKILKLACFVLFVRNGAGHTSKCIRWAEDKGGDSGSKWHQDSSVTTRMAKHVEQQNVIEMQCAVAAKQAEEQKNREIILKLMRSYTSWLRVVFHTQPQTRS